MHYKKNYQFKIHIYFLKSIYHIGHKSFKFSSQNFYHPLMLPFLFGVRKKLSILNVNYTLNCKLKALYLMALILKSKGKILIVNTNPDFYKIFTEINRFNMKSIEILSLQNKRVMNTLKEGSAKDLKQEECYANTLCAKQLSGKNTLGSGKALSKKVKNYKKNSIFQVSFCNGNWIGGTLTNWIQISKSIKTYALFYLKFDHFVFKNNIHFPKYKKMKKRFHGFLLDNKIELKNYFALAKASNASKSFSSTLNPLKVLIPTHEMNASKSFKNKYSMEHFLRYEKNEKKNIVLSFKKKPDILILLNPNQNKNVIQEAKILNIPIIAFTDSNTNLINISYSIPTNNQSFSFYYYFFNFFFKLAFFEKKFNIE